MRPFGSIAKAASEVVLCEKCAYRRATVGTRCAQCSRHKRVTPAPQRRMCRRCRERWPQYRGLCWQCHRGRQAEVEPARIVTPATCVMSIETARSREVAIGGVIYEVRFDGTRGQSLLGDYGSRSSLAAAMSVGGWAVGGDS